MKLLLFIVICALSLQAKSTPKEEYYKRVICNNFKGQVDVVLPDKTRADCLNSTYAIEIDFASKWAESIKKSLHSSSVSGRNRGVVLIMQNYTSDVENIKKFRKATKGMRITLWTLDSTMKIRRVNRY